MKLGKIRRNKKMRLIDSDKLLFSLEEWELNETPISTYPKPKEFTADDMQRMIWRTIRDCESAVEEQPTVKAILIEWLKRYEIIKGQEVRLQDAINEWEKENERP